MNKRGEIEQVLLEIIEKEMKGESICFISPIDKILEICKLKPRELSEEKIEKIANEVSGGSYKDYRYSIGWLNHLIMSDKDVWEEEDKE